MFCSHVFGNISGGFRGISRFFGNFAEIPEFRESATARNIRSPAYHMDTYLNKHYGVENIGNDHRLKPFLIFSQILLISTMAYE